MVVRCKWHIAPWFNALCNLALATPHMDAHTLAHNARMQKYWFWQCANWSTLHYTKQAEQQQQQIFALSITAASFKFAAGVRWLWRVVFLIVRVLYIRLYTSVLTSAYIYVVMYMFFFAFDHTSYYMHSLEHILTLWCSLLHIRCVYILCRLKVCVRVLQPVFLSSLLCWKK